MLHYAAEKEAYDDSAPIYAPLLARGAGETTKDNDGKRAAGLPAKSLNKVRAVLQ